MQRGSKKGKEGKKGKKNFLSFLPSLPFLLPLRSRSCRERHTETMKFGGERSATCQGCAAFSIRTLPNPRNLGRLRYFFRGVVHLAWQRVRNNENRRRA